MFCTRKVGNICLSSAFAIHGAVFARALSNISRMCWFRDTACCLCLLWWISLSRTALVLFQRLWHLSVHRRFLSHAQFFDDSSVFWEAITAESPFSFYRALCYDAGHVRILNILFVELWWWRYLDLVSILVQHYPRVSGVLRNLSFLLPAHTSDSHFFFQHGVIESLSSNPSLPHRLFMPLSLNIQVGSHLFVLIQVNNRLILPQ